MSNSKFWEWYHLNKNTATKEELTSKFNEWLESDEKVEFTPNAGNLAYRSKWSRKTNQTYYGNNLNNIDETNR